MGTPPGFLVLLPRGSLSLLHGTGQSHALPPLLPRPLCHPRGCRGVLGLSHSFCRNKHPKTPSERQPVPPPCQMCQLGTGWQENQEQFFLPGRAGEGGEVAAPSKASWRGSRAALPHCHLPICLLPSPGAHGRGHGGLLRDGSPGGRGGWKLSGGRQGAGGGDDRLPDTAPASPRSRGMSGKLKASRRRERPGE